MKRLIITTLFLVGTCVAMEHQQYRWALASRQGRRQTQEDTHCAYVRNVGSIQEGIFALFDGHGGNQASSMAKEQVVTIFDTNAHLPLADRIHKTFTDLDSAISGATTSGSTAVMAYMVSNRATVSWAGDSRAVHIRGNQVIAATQDHRPDMARERKRIESTGTTIWKAGGAWRVNGLAVSRALGDAGIKLSCQGAILAEPEIDEWELVSGDHIVLCCDGVSDVISDEELAQLIDECEHELYHDCSLPMADELVESYGSYPEKQWAIAVRDCAYDLLSQDNISVMVITYQPDDHSKTDC